MISKATLTTLEEPTNQQLYILGTRMRMVKVIRDQVLTDETPWEVVRSEGDLSHDPAPLQVKEVTINGRRYIVCFNPRQARKDAADREAIIASLQEQLRKGATHLVGNKGYRKFLTVTPGSMTINQEKVASEAKYDGKWVLTTNTDLSAKETALRYKELWMVEKCFREAKSILATRPVYHKQDETIRGHVFCSFLALILRKELEKRLASAGYRFEWEDMKRDLDAMQEIELHEGNKTFVIRSECQGTCGKIFQATRIALPQTIRVIQEEDKLA
jgi:hypothetical protein